MHLMLTPQQLEVRSLAERLCADFPDEYWARKDQSAEFPEEFYRAVADAGLLGIAMPRSMAVRDWEYPRPPF